jgi:hypothetical protein
VRTSLSGSITGLLKSGIGVSVLVVGATHYSPGGRETLPVHIIVYAGLFLSIQETGSLAEVLVNEAGFSQTICSCISGGW